MGLVLTERLCCCAENARGAPGGRQGARGGDIESERDRRGAGGGGSLGYILKLGPLGFAAGLVVGCKRESHHQGFVLRNCVLG